MDSKLISVENQIVRERYQGQDQEGQCSREISRGARFAAASEARDERAAAQRSGCLRVAHLRPEARRLRTNSDARAACRQEIRLERKELWKDSDAFLQGTIQSNL